MSSDQLFNGPVLMGQTGGALIGKGEYGCIFMPAPRCAGGRVFERVGELPAVGKVTEKDWISDSELRISKAISVLPLANNYFAVPVEECTPATPIADPDVAKCSALREWTREKAPVTMAVMPAGGVTLQKWADSNMRRAAHQYENLFIHLLEGMIIYQSAGFVHNDIQWGNILVDERGVSRYIDFGLAFRPAGVRRWADTKLGLVFKPEYIWQAPEIHALRIYRDKRSVAEGARLLREKSEEFGQLERTFPRRQRLEDGMGDFLRRVDQSEEGLVTYIRENGTRLDWWRLGLCMWQMWTDMMMELSEFTAMPIYRERRDVIMRIVDGMTRFNPMERMNPVTALGLLRPRGRLIV
jgi:hypothetical protein